MEQNNTMLFLEDDCVSDDENTSLDSDIYNSFLYWCLTRFIEDGYKHDSSASDPIYKNIDPMESKYKFINTPIDKIHELIPSTQYFADENEIIDVQYNNSEGFNAFFIVDEIKIAVGYAENNSYYGNDMYLCWEIIIIYGYIMVVIRYLDMFDKQETVHMYELHDAIEFNENNYKLLNMCNYEKMTLIEKYAKFPSKTIGQLLLRDITKKRANKQIISDTPTDI